MSTRPPVPSIAFGPPERTLDGATTLAGEMCDLAVRDLRGDAPRTRVLAAAARQLLAALIFAAAQGDDDTAATVDAWLDAPDEAGPELVDRLLILVRSPASTADEHHDARRALHLTREGLADDRVAASVRAVAVVALRGWAEVAGAPPVASGLAG